MELPATQLSDCVALKILALKLIDQLLFSLHKHPKTIDVYLRQKQLKISNYGFAQWARNDKYAD